MNKEIIELWKNDLRKKRKTISTVQARHDKLPVRYSKMRRELQAALREHCRMAKEIEDRLERLGIDPAKI